MTCLSPCRTKHISGSPRHKGLKKTHFIKNMRQYDTRNSRYQWAAAAGAGPPRREDGCPSCCSHARHLPGLFVSQCVTGYFLMPLDSHPSRMAEDAPSE